MTETTPPAPESFAAFFATEIAPSLRTLEEQRRDRVRATYTRIAGGAFVVVVGALIAWQAGRPVAAAIGLVLGLGLGLLWARRPARQHRDAVRALVIPALCRFLGNLEHHRDPGNRFDLERVKRAGILGSFNRTRLEDLFVGRYRDTDFRMVEARLRRARGRGGRDDGREIKQLVFSGLICEVSVPVEFRATVLLVGDKGPIGNRIVEALSGSISGLQPVSLDHADFEARYQVYSDDPAEAGRLLQPGLLDSLLALADDMERKALNCAFIDKRFLIALPQRRNLFEIGRLSRSLDHAEEDLRRLAIEFTIPQRLIDNLHGDRTPLLPEI